MKVKLKSIGICDNTRANEAGSVANLMQSIKDQGQLTPITVTPNFSGSGVKEKYVIVCGHRRYHAITKLGKTFIECSERVVTSKKDLMLDNLAENIHRVDVSPLEEGRFFNSLMKDHKMNKKEISIRLSVTPDYIARAVRAYEFIPKKYRDKIIKSTPSKRGIPKGKIALTVASDIITLSKTKAFTRKEQNQMFNLAMNEGATTADIKNVIRNYDASKTFDANIRKIQKARSKMVYTRMDVLLKAEEVEKLTKKYGWSRGVLIQKMLYGEIKERFTKP